MEIKTYNSFEEWHTDLTHSDPCTGMDVILNLADGPTAEDLEDAAKEFRDSCCGYNHGLGIVNGKVYFRMVDFGH